MTKYCVLDETKLCVECGECDRCDLDPRKICDNCCQCIEGADYLAIKIDEIIMDADSDDVETSRPGVYKVSKFNIPKDGSQIKRKK